MLPNFILQTILNLFCKLSIKKLCYAYKQLFGSSCYFNISINQALNKQTSKQLIL